MRRYIEQMVAALSRRRKYAAFFEWPDKEVKELGIVRELITSLESNAGYVLKDPRINRPDPPDCVCLNSAGELVALEVVELVSEEAVRLNAQGHDVYRHWRPGDLVPELSKLLAAKDKKTFHGGPYSEIAVVVFTAEMALSSSDATKELEAIRFGPFAQIDHAFLMFSYAPGQAYPVITLGLDA
jgi:hypothetical protein